MQGCERTASISPLLVHLVSYVDLPQGLHGLGLAYAAEDSQSRVTSSERFGLQTMDMA